MTSPLTFISWVLVVHLHHLPPMEISFEHFGPFNSQKCIQYETLFREQGIAVEPCKPEVGHQGNEMSP